MDTLTQQIIIGILGVALIVLIVMQYPESLILSIITGLLGFVSNKVLDTNTSGDTSDETTYSDEDKE